MLLGDVLSDAISEIHLGTSIVPLFVYPELSEDVRNRLSLGHRIFSDEATVDGFKVKTLITKCETTITDKDDHKTTVGSKSVEVDVLVPDAAKTNLK